MRSKQSSLDRGSINDLLIMLCPRCNTRKIKNVAWNSFVIPVTIIFGLIVLINFSNLHRLRSAHSDKLNHPRFSKFIGKKPSKDGRYSIDVTNYSQVDSAKRDKVKEMMIHAYNNYKLHAWGKSELRPMTKQAHFGSILGAYDTGLTIVDSLSTLYIMGMTNEFKEAREWIAKSFTLDDADASTSVFEVNIRFVGGFLSAYALTGDELFKDKAQYVAEKLLPAFYTKTGIPKAMINFKTGASGNYPWTGGQSILSEFGTLHLEFAYLSDVTGESKYKERVQKIRNVVKEADKPKGLYSNYIDSNTGTFGELHVSMGALGDSFYEYLLKAWLQSGRDDVEARDMFDAAMAAIMTNMVRISPKGLTYIPDLRGNGLDNSMGHLACFSGGLFGLAAKTLKNEKSRAYMKLARSITHTCHQSYNRSKTGLGPETFSFNGQVEATAQLGEANYYILRPETVESYFIMWRLTHEQKYRDWGWQVVQALEKHCRVDAGYSGVGNVYNIPVFHDDVQQSFFMAETLKYLYLLFSDDQLLSLDEWVFNTEAHPLPIRNVNPLYRAAEPVAQVSTESP